MFKRFILLPNSRSFFLFGRCGTGKSTLLNSIFEVTALTQSLLDEVHMLIEENNIVSALIESRARNRDALESISWQVVQ